MSSENLQLEHKRHTLAHLLAAAVLANVTIFANIFAGVGVPLFGEVGADNQINNLQALQTLLENHKTRNK